MPPLLRICGREDLIGKPGYMNYDEINQKSEEIVAILDQGFAQYNRDELVKILQENEIPVSEVRQSKDTVSDEQALANNYLFDHTYWNGKTAKFIASPIQFGDIIPAEHKGAPLHGEHTREVMAEYGYGSDQIEDYLARKIVGDVVEGSNRDYLLQLDHALTEHEIQDAYITQLAAAVRMQPECV